MVTEWGMSDKLGFLSYEEEATQSLFMGRSAPQNRQISDKTAALIDAEVRRLVDEAYAEATRILKKYRKELDLLARGLLEHETLSGEEIQTLLKGGDIVRPQEPELPASRIPSLDSSDILKPGAQKNPPRIPRKRPKKEAT
jgi:cell division protease FtsH